MEEGKYEAYLNFLVLWVRFNKQWIVGIFWILRVLGFLVAFEHVIKCFFV